MVLLERIELSASPLPRVCSTTELQQPDHRKSRRGHEAGRGSGRALQRTLALSIISGAGKQLPMTDTKLSREERLAAKLRENLRLRKTQARAIAAGDAQATKPGLSKGEPRR